MVLLLSFYHFFFLWPCHVPRGTSVLQSGTEPMPLTVEVRSLNHGSSGEVLVLLSSWL